MSYSWLTTIFDLILANPFLNSIIIIKIILRLLDYWLIYLVKRRQTSVDTPDRHTNTLTNRQNQTEKKTESEIIVIRVFDE